jgi:diaminopimelate epimerase
MVDINVYKIQGCGNSFVVCSVEQIRSYSGELSSPSVDPSSALQKAIQRICSRGFGLGTDGAMIVDFKGGGQAVKECDVFMYNPDGSWMGMCGNGIRCVMRYLALSGSIAADKCQSVTFRVGERIIGCSSEDGGRCVTVDMGEPVLKMNEIPALVADGELNTSIAINDRTFLGTCVGMGNPHFVIFQEIDMLEVWGALLETHATFPAKTNVEFATVLSPRRIKVSVWERGAGITLACGTGACAVTVAGVLTGRSDRCVDVELPGGTVSVEWRKENNRVYLSGPAREIVFGRLESGGTELKRGTLGKF